MKITINGKEYGLQWGLGAIELYCDHVGCDVDDLELAIGSSKSIDRTKAICTLTTCAIQNWCELNDITFDVTYRKFQAWLNEQPQETANDIITDWKKSMYFGKTIGEHLFGEIAGVAPAGKGKKKQPSVKP
jgi:hypothetical protein